MVNNIMGAMKTAGSSKSSQSQRNRKSPADDKSAFNQALSDAAAANSNTQTADKNTYDKKDVSAGDEVKDAEAVQEGTGEQETLGEGKVLGQDAFASTMQMGAEGIQTAGETQAAWNQALAGAEGDPKVLQEAVAENLGDAVQAGAQVKDPEENALVSGEIPMEMAGQAKEEGALNIKADSEMERQMASADADAKSMTGQQEVHKSDADAADIKAQAAAERGGLSHVHAQGNGGEAAIQAEVEVTGSGDIKPEYADMLKDMIARQIANGKQEIEISLTPRNLGELLVKVAYEAGETTVSIICTNAKTMEAMSSRASELGKVLETTLGDKMEVVVENKEQSGSQLYEDGKNDSGAQAQKEELERREAEHRRRLEKETSSVDFLQQLRLGLV